MIAVLDFGSQYTHLIARRIRQLGVRAEIFPPATSLKKIKNLSGAIFSGGPASVYDKASLTTSISNLNLPVPILGVCYGHQLISKLLGGKVTPGKTREYGREEVKIVRESPLFQGLPKNQKVWLSHGDQVTRLPKGFKAVASSKHCRAAAYEAPKRRIFGLQFHPEVVHTENGQKILENFLEICGTKKDWQIKDRIANLAREIKRQVGEEKVLIAVSGGVDSLVAATLLHKSLGEQVYPIFVDCGLLRKGEEVEVKHLFKNFKNFKFVDASKVFLTRLKGVTDPERKRKIIGKTFIEVFEDEASRLGRRERIRFLAQGTIYPDRIESAAPSLQAARIKSHHNVVLPKNLKLKLLEPLKDFYKDEVREIGEALGLPRERLWRHPFPGPGLAVRILGEVTTHKLKILREADAIYIEELTAAGVYDKIWQAFAVLLPVKSVGVMGDARTYQYMVSLRAVTSVDGMTADWFKMPLDVLEKISSRIVNEVKGVNRVVYDITQKPPATIEYE